MTDPKPNTIRVRWRAEPATVGGTPLAPIETVDDVPVTEDGRAVASYTVTIANTTVEVPLDIEVTDEMREPTATTNVTQPLVVEGQPTTEKQVIRDRAGEIERVVERRYPTHLFAVDASRDQSDDEPEPEDTDTDHQLPDAA